MTTAGLKPVASTTNTAAAVAEGIPGDVPGAAPALPILGTPEWHAWRRRVLGASNIGTVAGLSPYATPWDLYNHMTGIVADCKTEVMRQGSRFEAPIADMIAEDHPEWEIGGDGVTTHVSREDPLFVATPDRYIHDRASRTFLGLLQIKASGHYAGAEWGEPGTDAIPPGYLCQVTQEMAVEGVDRCYVARFVWGKPIDLYLVRFDPGLWAILRDLGRRFMVEHVLARKPPELDGSNGAWAYIAARHPKADGEIREATEAEVSMVLEREKHRLAEREAKAAKEAAELRICAAIGNNLGIALPDGSKFKWRFQAEAQVAAHTRKAGRVIDYRPKKET